MDVRTDEPERRFRPGTRLTTSGRDLTVAAARRHAGRLLVTFEEVADRSAAEGLRGAELLVDVPADEHPEDPTEYYDHQLVGLQVLSHDGSLLGEVREVLHLPAHEVLVVRREEQQQTMVPFVAALVPEVDLDAGIVRVVDQAGLHTEDR